MIRRPPRSTLFPTRRSSDLGQAFFESDHAQQVFAVALRIRIGPSAGDPGAFLAQCDSFQLPNEVANKRDRKSTRLNSSHSQISYAVFCLKKKNKSMSLTCLP